MNISKEINARSRWCPAARITLIYAGVACIWILVSDQLLVYLVHDVEKITQLQTLKAGFYIIATSALLFWLIKRQLSSLQDNSERFNRWKESNFIGILHARADGEIIDANNTVLTMLGYSCRDLQDGILNLTKLTPVEFSSLDEKAVKEAAEKGYWTPFEKEYFHKDGTRVPILVGGSLFQKESDEFIIFIIDLTERKHVEEKLLQNQYYLKKAQELGSIGTWELDIQKNILTWTEETYKVFGLPLDTELNYEVFINSIHPNDRDYIKEKWGAALNHEPYDIEHRIIVDGHVRWIRAKAEIEFDENGKPLKGIGCSQDISEQKNMIDNLQKMQKLKSVGLLAGGIAHDFNNILTVILGNIAIAKLELSDDHPSYQFLEASEKSMDRAIHLTNQLLTFSKGGDPIRDDVDIAMLIDEIVRFDLTGSNVKPVFKFSKDLWRANVDKGQMQQVFSNLTINADQAMPDGGHLYVALENVTLLENEISGVKKGKYLKATIRDEGTGIDKKLIDQIFDPYFSTKQKGSGLGLATTYSIMYKHGGYINVNSELCEGTTFTLYVPAYEFQRPKKSKQSAKASANIAKNARILVMDDDEKILDLLTVILKNAGYSVATAPEGKQAIEMYKQSIDAGDTFDAVIMDLTIPGGVGGKETVKQILKIDPAAKCVVSSGYANDPILANYGKYGFKNIVSKPFSINKLPKVLEEVLAG